MWRSFRPRSLADAALLWAVAAVLALAMAAPAQVVLNTQHTDLNLSDPSSTWGNPNPGGTWSLTVGDRDGGITYASNGTPGATNWALLTVAPGAQQTRPAGSAFDFLGVPEGQSVWILPQSQDPNLLYLGVSGYRGDSPSSGRNGFGLYTLTDPRINNGNPSNGPWIKMSLVAVRGPGKFSVFQNGFTGPIVWMASADGIGANDDLFIVDGGHIHYNWAFTQPGRYEVDFQASAFLADASGNATTLTVSSPPVTTYVFDVQQVPEPSALALMALGLAGFAARHRRRAAPSQSTENP
jgi:surface-anchored protein